jgi:molybdate transport system substrate-binding protein
VKGRRIAVAVAAATMLLLAACSSNSSSSSPSTSSPPGATLTVLAAASLTNVFPKIGAEFTKQHPGTAFHFSFAGTDTLTAQIEQGVPADVFAGASTKYGDQLYGESLIEKPVPFATNTLVLIVPPDNPAKITSPKDLTKPGIKLVVGAETVPVGSYTRTVLANLNAQYGAGYDQKVLANVVSNEDAVTGVLQKVQLGEADAGFVYVTDAAGAGNAVKAIELPQEAQATATYPIAEVKSSTQPTLAQQFVDFVLSPTAQQILTQAKFGPAPSASP